jgi:cellobiose phosphorylase
MAFPPALFVKSMDGHSRSISSTDAAGHPCIGVHFTCSLAPGEGKEIAFVFGYTRQTDATAIGELASSLWPSSIHFHGLGSAFAPEWRRAVPEFENEKDPALRREMQWNVAVLEAMATWREYYDETIIPQGSMYDYVWGWVASSRDLAQQALPLCHTHPALARSTLRFIMKRTLPDGEIKLNDQGCGWVASSPQQTSDQQLYFFMLLTEYLRVTHDASVLSEQIEYYPRECSGRDSGLAHVRQAFLFLRDRIGTGGHGIVRLWNSDWNDNFYEWPISGSYNSMFETAESNMNSTMAIVGPGELAMIFSGIQETAASELAAAMLEYRGELLNSWLRDLGDRSFPRRGWTDAQTPVGETDMWLEPQGYALSMPELPPERKRRLFAEVERRLLHGERLGARQIEKPIDVPGTPLGARENGGFWFALNGPLVLGVATFDRATAESLFRKMTFARYASSFPKYWTGQWSASDSLDSSLLKSEGLSSNIGYCAHAHAWPLYCYLRLRSV